MSAERPVVGDLVRRGGKVALVVGTDRLAVIVWDGGGQCHADSWPADDVDILSDDSEPEGGGGS